MKIILTMILFFGITLLSYCQQNKWQVNTKSKAVFDSNAVHRNSHLTMTSLKDIILSFHVGYLGACEYGNTIKEYYAANGYDVSGLTVSGFLEFGGRAEFKIIDNLYFYPEVSIYFSSIPKKVVYTYLNNYTEDKSTGTFMLVPEFGSNYYYRLDQNLFYVGLQFGYPLISDPEDDFAFSGDGISVGYYVGYRREISNDKSLGIEIGYLSVPATVSTAYNSTYYSPYYPAYSFSPSKNFGGFLIKFIYSFSVGN